MCYDNIETLEIWYDNLIHNYDIIIPDCQRIINNDNVNSIVNYQKDMYIKYGEFKFIGVLIIVNFNNNFYLIDGQHRYTAIYKLYNEYKHNFKINIQIITVNSYEQLNEIYNIINKNTPLPNFEFKDNNEKNIIQEVCDFFKQNYKNVWSKNERSRRPFISFNNFQESLKFIIDNTNIQTSKKLIDVLQERNELLSGFTIDEFKKVNDNMYNKAKELRFYLGLYTFDSEQNYGYTWARDIVVYNNPNIKFQKNNQNYRKKNIPKTLKSTIWNKYIGSHIGEVFCIVCNNNTISTFTFECGHIISEKNGGEISEDNLIPICSHCNKSMGTMHMDEFVKNHFKLNYNNYKNRKYKQIKNNKNSWF